MMKTRGWSGRAALVLLLCACGDDGATETAADSETTGASDTEAATGAASDATSGTSDASAGPTGSGSEGDTEAATEASAGTSDGGTSDGGTTDASATDPSATDPSATEASSDGTTGEPAVCGDGVVEGDEECDDGDANADDSACTTSCVAASCGDGLLWAGNEECDEGDANADNAACTASCAVAVCGDGLLWEGSEECDDGNGVDDGCTNACVDRRAFGIAVGDTHACALLYGGRVKCWGDGADGRLGLGDTEDRGNQPGEMGADLPYVDLGDGVVATKISGGRTHTCALLEGGAIKCWGRNHFAQLGLGHLDSIGDQPGEMGDALPSVALGDGEVAVDIISGGIHTCALLESGGLKCWGNDQVGQLGVGGSPPSCGGLECRGATPDQMGDALPPVDLGAGAVINTVVAGYVHTCALLEGGGVKCWGHGWGAGQGAPDHVGDGPGELGDALPLVPLGGDALNLAAGLLFTCAELDGVGLKCWGMSSDGSLGLGFNGVVGDAPGEMAALVPVDLGAGFTAESVGTGPGAWHSCAVSASGDVKCWGRNNWGQLGLGDQAHRGDEPGEMGDSLPLVDLDGPVAQAACQWELSCALLEDGGVKCWGRNTDGVLGQEDNQHRGLAPGQMGANLPRIRLHDNEW